MICPYYDSSIDFCLKYHYKCNTYEQWLRNCQDELNDLFDDKYDV
jgi:hypothetical protein